jgi:hypothetical protein
MTLSKDVPSSFLFLIAPDLLHDPRANYLPWKAVLFKLAASQLPTLSVSGCLFLVQTQPEYDAFPLHVVSGNVIAPPSFVCNTLVKIRKICRTWYFSFGLPRRQKVADS